MRLYTTSTTRKDIGLGCLRLDHQRTDLNSKINQDQLMRPRVWSNQNKPHQHKAISISNEVNLSINKVGCNRLIYTGATVSTLEIGILFRKLNKWNVQTANRYICISIEPYRMSLTILNDCTK